MYMFLTLNIIKCLYQLLVTLVHNLSNSKLVFEFIVNVTTFHRVSHI